MLKSELGNPSRSFDKPRFKFSSSDSTIGNELLSNHDNNRVDKNRIHLLIGVTGSVAAIKVPELIQRLNLENLFKIRIILTQGAQHFVTREEIQKIDPSVECYTDENEWQLWSKKGDPVLHIELRKWADILAIVPLDCNTLAKISNGICDNLITCVARAWNIKTSPFIVAPAMNTLMWEHPFTSRQLSILENELGVYIIEPVSKLLACGDVGNGALTTVETIVEQIKAVVTTE
ncbi:hypothetical protein C9374_001351 [Naegleria lovaniensis]|uniref:Flavoprotein domain-containing protein n=1 Tax=Naegleria lovaniensis TaxID=51637 RepID=A0AA88GRX5_NAELO|nr:uncharacterized protein C9374_001351 [Naegleria lovaniensis]KAG2387757.1 hypothetical protein C9374_001351 [Naegleria lovaniensis]